MKKIIAFVFLFLSLWANAQNEQLAQNYYGRAEFEKDRRSPMLNLLGTLFICLMTTGAAMSEGLKEALNWWNPAGPLVGKTFISVFAWLISWFIMNRLWQNKESDL